MEEASDYIAALEMQVRAMNALDELLSISGSGSGLFNSGKKDTGEGLNKKCSTKSALSLDDSSKQKSLPDVDATENKNSGEALKRESITKSILGLEDLQHHSGGRPDDAANSFGVLEEEYQLPEESKYEDCDIGDNEDFIPCLVFVEYKKEEPLLLEYSDHDDGDGFHGYDGYEEDNDDDGGGEDEDVSSEDESEEDLKRRFEEFIAKTKKKWEEESHNDKLLRTKKEATLGFEDLQHHSGGRPDDAANSFGAIYDPGIHTTHSFTQNSIDVLEALPILKQPNDCVPLLSLGRLKLEGCVQEEKSQDLPRLVKINGVEQRVIKSPRYLEGLTAQSTSSSRWPIGLPDGRHILELNPLEQSTKNVAHVARADLCSPTLPLPEKKMARTRKRKYRIMRAIFGIHQQHFGRRCEGTAKSFHATRICRKSGINRPSRVKRIHKRHWIHQWPFRQKWATRKGYSSGDERPFEVSSLSMGEKLDSGILFIQMSKFVRSSPRTLALPNGGKIVGPIASSSSEFVVTNDRPHLVRQDQSSSTASHHERKNTREMSDKQGITMSSCSVEDLQQHFGCKHKDAVKRLDVSISMFKSTCRRHRGYWWPCRIQNNEQEAFDATNNKAHLVKADQRGFTVSNLEKENSREALKRECQPKSVLSLEDLQHQYGGRHKNAGKGLGYSLARQSFEESQESRFHKLNSLARKSFKVLQVLPLWEQSNNIRHLVQQRRLAVKCWVRLKKSQDLPRTLQIMNCSGSLTHQSASSLHWPISLPDGGRAVSLLEKKIMRKTFKRKYNAIGVSFEDHEQHFSSRCDYAANSLGVKPICEQHGFNLVSTVKRIRRQYGIHRCTFRQGYSFGGERPAGVLSPSIEEKVVSRLQFLHISWLARSSRRPSALRSGSEISGHIAFSSSDFPATNKGAHPGRQDQCGSSASHPEKKRGRETKDGEGENNTITREDLEQHFGKKREEVADLLGVSVSTFKRICRRLGISEWLNWRRKSGNSSPSIQRICREQRIPPWPDWRSNRVFIPPDQNGENNPSPTFNTLSNNGQITTQNEMGGQHSEPNERLPDSFEDPNFQSIGNGSVAEFENHNTTHDSHHGHCGDANTGTGSVAEFENHNTIHDSHHGHCGNADVPFSAVQNQTEVAGGLDYFCDEVFESSNFAFPVYSDAAAPSQPVPTILPTMPHSQIASTQILGENMESFEDWRNLLATQKEHFPEGHVSGSVNYTISSSQPMSTTPHSTESPEYLRYALASVVEHRMETNHYGSSNLIDPSFSNLAPSLPMQPTIPHMTSVLTERQDSTLVKLNATYGEDTIKLRLPLTSGIAELKQVVSKQLELGLDSFKVMYKDEYGEWIKITLDEEVREHLQLTLSGNQVSKLWVVNKVPNTTDFCCNCECDKCRSFKGNRP